MARLRNDIVRRTPSDERVRSALQYRLPTPAMCLPRLEGRDNLDGLEIEHIFPVAAASAWRGCEEDKSWGERSEEEKSRLCGLSTHLATSRCWSSHSTPGPGITRSTRSKQDYYRRSDIAAVQRLMDVSCWGAEQILSRTAELTTSFLEIWPRPMTLAAKGDEPIDRDSDVPGDLGYYPGWATEFEYACFRGEILEVRNIRQLFLQVVRRLLEERRDAVLAWNRGLFSTVAEHAQYELIVPDLYVNKAWFLSTTSKGSRISLTNSTWQMISWSSSLSARRTRRSSKASQRART